MVAAGRDLGEAKAIGAIERTDLRRPRGSGEGAGSRRAEKQAKEASEAESIGQPQKRSVKLTRATQVEPQAIRWLWPGWLARGKLHLLAGTAGDGKTTAAVSLAALITEGGRLPMGLRPRLVAF